MHKPQNESSENTQITSVPWGPWQALAASSSVYFMSLFIAAFAAWTILSRFLGGIELTISIYAVSSVLTIAGAVGFLKLRQFSLGQLIGKFRAKDLLFVPLLYGLYLVCTFTVQSLLSLIPAYDSSQAQDFGLDGAVGPGLIGVLMVLVILPPLAEEIIFRGIMYKGMARKWGRIAAAVVTSILFGLVHAQWNVAADTFVLSLVLILGLELTGSLYVPIALHMLKNFIAYILVFVLAM